MSRSIEPKGLYERQQKKSRKLMLNEKIYVNFIAIKRATNDFHFWGKIP